MTLRFDQDDVSTETPRNSLVKTFNSSNNHNNQDRLVVIPYVATLALSADLTEHRNCTSRL